MSRKKDIIRMINEHFPESPIRELVKDYICNLAADVEGKKVALESIRNKRNKRIEKRY